MKHTELLHGILEKSGAIQLKGRLKSVMAAAIKQKIYDEDMCSIFVGIT